ncbi:MAG: hypothetical protein AB8A66_03025 [Prochlorococcus sp.]
MGRGNAFLGLGSDIYAPTFDENNYLNGYDPDPENKQTAVSGYAIRPDYVEARRSQDPQNSTTADIPVDAPGIFHVDYQYQGIAKEIYLDNTNLLDKFNMGYVDLDGEIVKPYIQTSDYPYTVHTPLMQKEISTTKILPSLTVKGQSKYEILFGTTADESHQGASHTEIYIGLEGNDYLDLKEGKDFLSGGDDEDYLVGGEGDDDIFGGNDNDTVNGGYGSDRMHGGEGSDQFIYRPELDS